ncbi:2-succinyl-6-hydroxy-2,4-cyclohexadiene-1-carboxylate synthase [Endozoicomonas sp. GU-1]|uniref:2-succinyl-6-hydroxy-2, 4-cyclohexadiene-1-carboxylate synthase n=1 Tax=Endozoicomonas sp. GU-1 TaxID=3009078 RepID=UPI0022B2D1F0|nr:2-succinyl-6-hydroxy-2,4-cyclohexadiene-1-carboxylate synthase [Endozoicomonas sp. GU-1]WBA79978.1 2-succinyl-6-hydroxy-2,4-cyclohexadiene-1-carboxylate synthase [Endozoicomonas sp. GU-1]WBA87551.1 2-succinyl-6-hydroxy-2,4-cyclohexadiene-1-carboxylate synthase [Endozoicomonas sp. GU-1]
MSLSYYCAGDVHAPVLVLLHGFLGRANDWDSLLAALKDDYCLIAVDLPGHGSSQWLEEDTQGADYFCYRLEQTVQTIEQVEGISLKRFNLLGYSLGGRLAMAYTTAFPQRVAQLLLEGAHPGLVSEQERSERYWSDLQWARRFTEESVADVLLDWYKQPVFSDLDDSQIGSLIAERSKGSGLILANALMAFSLSKQPDYRRALSRLKADCQLSAGSPLSVHYFYGENDHKFGQLGQHLLTEHVIHSVHPVTGCGHNVHREQPEVMARLLRELF